MMDAVRKPNGQFSKGQTGNPAGRPRKRVENHKLPAARRRKIFKVLDHEIDVKLPDGSTERMTLFEANVWRLAHMGANGNRVAAQQIIAMALKISDVDLERNAVVQKFFAESDARDRELERLRPEPKRGGVLIVPPSYLSRNPSIDSEDNLPPELGGRDPGDSA